MIKSLEDSIREWAKGTLDDRLNKVGIEEYAREVAEFDHSSRVKPLVEEFGRNPEYGNALRYCLESDREWWQNVLLSAGGQALLTEKNVLQLLREIASDLVTADERRCPDLAWHFVRAGWILKRHWGDEWAAQSGYDAIRTAECRYRACFDNDMQWVSESARLQVAAKYLSKLRTLAREFIENFPSE